MLRVYEWVDKVKLKGAGTRPQNVIKSYQIKMAMILEAYPCDK
jgi:hypothetical protein